ncbi:hypothetical protein RB195_018068 [Necator americanus]|uniref:Uncharacterized protein n=1 Tax=Necator americanus TaxID=51031 RepID=A0ABR1C9N6_NECAM
MFVVTTTREQPRRSIFSVYQVRGNIRELAHSYLSCSEVTISDYLVSGMMTSIDNYTIYCGGTDERKVGGCAKTVRSDYNKLVEEIASNSSGCAFVRLRDRRGLKLCIGSAHAPTETTDDHKDAFYDELNTMISKLQSQQTLLSELMRMQRWNLNNNPLCWKNGSISLTRHRTTEIV